MGRDCPSEVGQHLEHGRLRGALRQRVGHVSARGSYSINEPSSVLAGAGSSHEIMIRVGALTPTFTSTPADALVIQPLRFALDEFRTTKKLAASRRRLSSLVSAS